MSDQPRWGGSVLIVAAVTMSLVACGGDDPPSRVEVIGELASTTVVPTFERFTEQSATLVDDVAAACDGGTDAEVDRARSSVADTRERWLSTQAFWSGPVMERRSPAVVDWPIRVADIEALIERSASGDITADVIANNVGADTRGLTAMRWVLDGDGAGQRLADERWCEYLVAAGDVIAAEAASLVADWTDSWEGGPPFAELLGDAGPADEWLGMLVNDNVFLVHAVAEPVREEGDLAPADPAADREAQLGGVATMVDAVAPLLEDDLVERLDDEVEAARSAYTDGDVEGGRAAAAELEATLATEVASALDVTIGFSDADGDSAG